MDPEQSSIISAAVCKLLRKNILQSLTSSSLDAHMQFHSLIQEGFPIAQYLEASGIQRQLGNNTQCLVRISVCRHQDLIHTAF